MSARTSRTVRARPSGLARRQRVAYLFLLPWIVGYVCLLVGPLAASLYLSFTDYDLLTPPKWVGLGNYVRMFAQDPRYLHSLGVTIVYAAISVPVKVFVSLAVAMLLQRPIRGLSFFRAAFYLPSLLGGSVAIAVLWQRLFSGDGLVNTALGYLGLHNLPAWVNHPDYALGTLVMLALWEFGAPMVIMLAGLQQIPESLYEAARVDGAGWWRRLTSVTLPVLSPVVFFVLVMQVIAAFKTFTPAYVVSGGNGGPADSTLLYGLYLYQTGFSDFAMGYASAMAWILVAIIGALTGVVFATSKLWVHYAD